MLSHQGITVIYNQHPHYDAYQLEYIYSDTQEILDLLVSLDLLGKCNMWFWMLKPRSQLALPIGSARILQINPRILFHFLLIFTTNNAYIGKKRK